MVLTDAQKLKIEAPLKESFKKMGEALIELQRAIVENSPTKVDDAISPMIEPMEKEQFNKLVDSLKL